MKDKPFRAVKLVMCAGMLVALTAGTATAARTPAPNFADPEFYKAGPGPIEVINGDFDEDGIEDLVTANRFEDGTPGNGDGDVSFLKGNRNGTFQEARQFDASVSATDVVKGDFDGDGNLDLAITDPDSTPPSVVILRGDGDGAFEPLDTVESGGDLPFDLGMGDFDKDGDVDLAVANTNSNNVGVLENDGTGNFELGQTTQTGGTGPRSVSPGDFDRDRDLDLAVANSGTDNVGILENEGGVFAPATTTVPVGDNPVDIAVLRLNGDNALDFTTANNGSDDVSVRLGRGDGTFRGTQEYPSGDEGPFSLTDGDFNADGDRDVAVANQFTRTGGGAGNNQGTVGVLSGRGDGTLRAARVFDTGDGPTSITAGTFNRDGKIDLATANFGAGGPEEETDTVSVLINTTGRR